MKHHFADVLDREGDFWAMVPNSERFLSRIEDADATTRVLTLMGSDADFERARDLPELEELTLHEASAKQLQFVSQLTGLRRLRITHARPKTLEFLEPLRDIEELVLEYVSGVSDLSPLRGLGRLRSLHIENLRKVSDFSGLGGLAELRYLSIRGTLDWKQPIEDFEFLRTLPTLELLALWEVINRSAYPATLPFLALKRLKRLKMAWNVFSAEEHAFLEVGLAGVPGADWGPYTEFEKGGDEIWFEFTGKRSGAVKRSSKTAERRCREFAEKYARMKSDAASIINGDP